MAKSTVPVNFKDDIMNSAMGGKRRYRMINNSDETISLEDVTTYDQVGSTFGAAQINATNKAVNAAADASKIIDDIDAIRATTQSGYMAGALALKQVDESLGGFEFYTDEQGKAYYKPMGADSGIPFNSSNYIYLVKDGIVQDNTGINFNVESLIAKDGYLQPSVSSIGSGKITLPSLDLSKYKSIVVDMSSHDKSGVAIYWYIGGTNSDYGSRQNFAENGYTGIKDVACACRNTNCRLYNLYLIPN